MEGAMILKEVIEMVVNFWVHQVDIGSESDDAGLVGPSQLCTLIVIPDAELSELVRLSVEDVGKREKNDEVYQDHVEAAAPRRRHDLMVHQVVEDPL